MVNFKKALAAVMVASLVFPSVAFADNYTGVMLKGTDGTTDLTVVLASSGDVNGSDENVTFTVPTSINFVMKADGTLVAPSPSAVYIENESAFSISAPGFSYEPDTGWNLGSYIEDAYPNTSTTNSDGFYSNVSFGSDGIANTYSLGVSIYAGEDNCLTSSDILSLYSKANNMIDAANTAIKNGEDVYSNATVESASDEFNTVFTSVGKSADEVFLHDTSKSYDFSSAYGGYKSSKTFQYDGGSISSDGSSLTTLGEKTIMLPNIIHNTKSIGLEDNKANFSFVGLAANVTKDISSSDKFGTITWYIAPLGTTYSTSDMGHGTK